MPRTEKTAPTTSMPRGPVYGTSFTMLDAGEHHPDDDELHEEADAPRQIGRDESTEQRADRGGNGGGRPTSA